MHRRTDLPAPSPSHARILISGSSGLLGRAIAARRRAAGDTVVPLLRRRPAGTTAGQPCREDGVLWHPGSGTLQPREVSGFDAVIHLAGEPVLGLWTTAKRRRILDSRAQGTAELARALAAADRPPRVVLCASGINVYGDRGDAILDESEPTGDGFLAEVCAAWEAASQPLAGISRVVPMRIGVVLSTEGGALAQMLPVFRLGLGAIIAGGRGYVSWIALGDLLRAVDHLLATDTLAGPVNLVAPNPVTSRQLSEEVAAALGRRVRLHLPGWPFCLLLGQMARETILGSVRAVPARLLRDGFRFDSPTLRQALQTLPLGPGRR